METLGVVSGQSGDINDHFPIDASAVIPAAQQCLTLGLRLFHLVPFSTLYFTQCVPFLQLS